MSRPAHAPRKDDAGPAGEGPFRADQLHDGDNYELSNGHAILCMGSGDRHGLSNTQGAKVIDTDPGLAEGAGVDVGFSFNEGKNLRAPDIAAGNLAGKSGWAKGVPPLAIEYADAGQNERELQKKIAEFLAAGTRYIWVVRLQGPLRVEVYRPGKKKVIVGGDEELSAPGVLKNPVPVRSLVDRDAANQTTLRNLLNQMGFRDLRDVQAQAEAKGEARGEARGAAQGEARTLRRTVGTLCRVLGIAVSSRRQGQIDKMDTASLEELIAGLERDRAWPKRRPRA